MTAAELWQALADLHKDCENACGVIMGCDQRVVASLDPYLEFGISVSLRVSRRDALTRAAKDAYGVGRSWSYWHLEAMPAWAFAYDLANLRRSVL